MRYYILPVEGISDDMRAALSRGLGLSPFDEEACERHCARYGVDDVAAYIEELDEAWAALATAGMIGAPIMVDRFGRLCYDVPTAPDDGSEEPEAEPWNDGAWLTRMIGQRA